MAIDPQRLAQIMQRMQLAQPGGAGGPPPGMAPQGGPPPGAGGPPPSIPMQINGTMTPQPQGGPPRPMMPPGGMPPGGMPPR